MSKLSILIPARQEIYLKQTIDDIFKHAEGDIEVLVGLDGLEENDIDLVALAQIKYTQKKLQFVINEKPMGQRAMTNYLAQKATGDYLMKLDAHCSLSRIRCGTSETRQRSDCGCAGLDQSSLL
jgi:glycosyltransferase involved in cell wall biosynthesis